MVADSTKKTKSAQITRRSTHPVKKECVFQITAAAAAAIAILT